MSDDTLTISSATGRTEATFVPGANMVCCSLTHDGEEILELRRGLPAYAETGKTMGIPLLYPWANRLHRFCYEAAGRKVDLREDDPRISRDSQGLPIHGVVPRLLRWEVADRLDRGALGARLLWTSAELLELFPYRHEVRLRIEVSDGELRIVTTVCATQGDPVPISFGYHPYLRVPRAPRESWDVQLGATRQLLLDDRSIPTGERAPLTERRVRLGQTSWDTPLDGLMQPPEFGVTGDGMTVTVTFRSGYAFAQVFAPAGQQFICFEPMTAAADALNSGDGLRILSPGAEHRAEFAVTIAA